MESLSFFITEEFGNALLLQWKLTTLILPAGGSQVASTRCIRWSCYPTWCPDTTNAALFGPWLRYPGAEKSWWNANSNGEQVIVKCRLVEWLTTSSIDLLTTGEWIDRLSGKIRFILLLVFIYHHHMFWDTENGFAANQANNTTHTHMYIQAIYMYNG